VSVRDLLEFGRGFVARPRATGAVLPSSGALARLMLEEIDWEQVGAAVELGPGTGVFTAEIQRRLRDKACFFAVELNSGFVSGLRDRFPGLSVHDSSATELRAICGEEGLSAVDCVVSSLPWASLPAADHGRILQAIADVLRPGGWFVTFAYLQGLMLPAGRQFRELLPRYFSETARSPTTWANLPPAFVYRCRR
jgi:phosphatidylethanolamine/phosphatidyl-N-methylethanolamine N-methyltransferase